MNPITLTIDGKSVTVAPGDTVLDAARTLGIDIPTLCFMKDSPPNTSCLVCLVRQVGHQGLVPACATKVVAGMEIESETAEIHEARKTTLDLILSEHVGDCLAPCQRICPVDLPIPIMIRLLRNHKMSEAIRLVRKEVALPGILGRVCHRPCEGGCRRATEDEPVAIALLERFAADENYRQGDFFLPERAPKTGKRVAIVGTGPAGLTAGYHLLRHGQEVNFYEASEQAGGSLRDFSEDKLPATIIANEIEIIRRLGATFTFNTRVGEAKFLLTDLLTNHDAVLIATGAVAKHALITELPAAKDGVQADRQTFLTPLKNIFAAGEVVRASGLTVRAAQAGKDVATCLTQHLAGKEITGRRKPFTVFMNKAHPDELAEFMKLSSDAARMSPATNAAGFSTEEADAEGWRCLHCDCRAAENCDLRIYADKYGAEPNRFRSEKLPFEQDVEHPEIIFEPRKCIACGRCVQVARAADEELGLSFAARSFAMHLGVPLQGSLAEGLKIVGQEAVRVCPTAGLAAKEPDEIACASNLPPARKTTAEK